MTSILVFQIIVLNVHQFIYNSGSTIDSKDIPNFKITSITNSTKNSNMTNPFIYISPQFETYYLGYIF